MLNADRIIRTQLQGFNEHVQNMRLTGTARAPLPFPLEFDSVKICMDNECKNVKHVKKVIYFSLTSLLE